jgi:hypothetical protein
VGYRFGALSRRPMKRHLALSSLRDVACSPAEGLRNVALPCETALSKSKPQIPSKVTIAPDEATREHGCWSALLGYSGACQRDAACKKAEKPHLVCHLHDHNNTAELPRCPRMRRYFFHGQFRDENGLRFDTLEDAARPRRKNCCRTCTRRGSLSEFRRLRYR